jgi:hypothetical protein
MKRKATSSKAKAKKPMKSAPVIDLVDETKQETKQEPKQEPKQGRVIMSHIL